jgi:hypothetical protein
LPESSLQTRKSSSVFAVIDHRRVQGDGQQPRHE